MTAVAVVLLRNSQAVSRRVLAVCAALCALLLSACRLDVSVDVVMQPDGTGTVTVDAVADAELVAQVPDVVDELRLDDAVANGWRVEGPGATEGGGMSIRLVHDFSNAEELASVLNSIGPPLVDMQAARTPGADDAAETTNAVDGSLVLPNGFGSFADAELVEAVGGQPFEEELAASGLTPDQAMSFTLRVALPGELVTSTGTEAGDGVQWTAELDGSSQRLLTQTVQRPAGSGNGWARPLATIALVLLVGWVGASVVFIAFVAIARRSRRRRRERALRNLAR
jgi:hypothetical protein